MLKVSPDSPAEAGARGLPGRRIPLSAAWIAFVAGLAFFVQAIGAADPAIESIPGCTLVAAPWADGDSFPVRLPGGEEKVFRLYFVDCIETDVADVTGKRRLREQARYFGVEDYAITREFGLEATRFVAKALARPFTVHTTFSKAPGRGGKPRHYVFITTAAGRDLGEELVEAGLARAFGFGRETPDGTHRDDWQAQLEDAELAAALRGRGLWKHCDPEKIVAMRREQREELRALESIDDAFTDDAPAEPVDVNSATIEELVRAGFRESVADEVVKRRPFRNLEELDDVPGIGEATINKVRPYLKVVLETPPKPAP
jgi:competence protein ComEA